ncbi:MAG TPA: hypothetical protein VKZ55_03590 [Microthrixaceae bacterium]|nr:hypothetical protein [Microthrixaceae bacterium]
MRSRLLSLVGAVVAAVLVGLLVGHGWGWLEEARIPDDREPGDRVATAAAALREDPVFVAVDARRWIPAEAEARLEELASDSEVPVRIAAWYGSREAGYGNGVRAVHQLARVAGEEAVYVLLGGPGDLHVRSTLTTHVVRTYELPEARGDLVRRLEELIAALPEATRERYTTEEFSYWGGRGGAVAAGLLLGAVGIPVVLLLIGVGRLLVGRPFRMIGGWR